MKFTYDEKPDRGECVAYIDGDGDLMVKEDSGECIWFSKSGIVYNHSYGFNPANATRKFYPGDSITITF